ncbi:hypothetical protein MRX96_052500 [Rhipicephalus microplus]
MVAGTVSEVVGSSGASKSPNGHSLCPNDKQCDIAVEEGKTAYAGTAAAVGSGGGKLLLMRARATAAVKGEGVHVCNVRACIIDLPPMSAGHIQAVADRWPPTKQRDRGKGSKTRSWQPGNVLFPEGRRKGVTSSS